MRPVSCDRWPVGSPANQPEADCAFWIRWDRHGPSDLCQSPLLDNLALNALQIFARTPVNIYIVTKKKYKGGYKKNPYMIKLELSRNQ